MSESPFHAGKLLLFDKPLGWTSFDLVNKVRFAIEKHYKLKRMSIKVGHAGTLDPLATGLMLICTGKFTKQIDTFQGLPKTYTGTFTLGGTTVSFDLEKEVDQHFPTAHITEEMIYEVAKNFIGTHDQEPPVFSAKKIDGERAYELARAGKDVKMKTSSIEITAFEITRIALPEVDFRVECTKGTYIRSLARDFGLALKSGAYLSKLCRTAIGPHTIENAQTIEQFTAEIRSTV
ncbi:MAG TPA: tRNA pseudouridine(55) synthase TruB [Flavobacteriales bacterium]|nr:tRNA pseudouridine(55) synthase TruB [Flavobacteriales bacterium]HPH81929.1 tRNA pseudouridine(55) synthase TruB [Flavobacteriales bacterium]